MLNHKERIRNLAVENFSPSLLQPAFFGGKSRNYMHEYVASLLYMSFPFASNSLFWVIYQHSSEKTDCLELETFFQLFLIINSREVLSFKNKVQKNEFRSCLVR